MKDLIKSCLTGMDISYKINTKNISASVDYFRIIFRSSDLSYHKLELFYNDSTIFSRQERNLALLCGSNLEDYRDKVYASVVDLSSYEECVKEVNNTITLFRINNMIDSYLEKIVKRIWEIEVNGIKILKVSATMKPISCLVVCYSLNGVVRKPLKQFIGEENTSLAEILEERELGNLINEIVRGGF